jgi:hypothetical protein
LKRKGVDAREPGVEHSRCMNSPALRYNPAAMKAAHERFVDAELARMGLGRTR